SAMGGGAERSHHSPVRGSNLHWVALDGRYPPIWSTGCPGLIEAAPFRIWTLCTPTRRAEPGQVILLRPCRRTRRCGQGLPHMPNSDVAALHDSACRMKRGEWGSGTPIPAASTWFRVSLRVVCLGRAVAVSSDEWCRSACPACARRRRAAIHSRTRPGQAAPGHRSDSLASLELPEY